MEKTDQQLPVSIYFAWQWWEEHYQKYLGRPDDIDMDWLDAHYLGRQRFLYENFGQFDIGQAEPVLHRGFVGKVLPLNTVIIPAVLGMRIATKDIGGYQMLSLSPKQLRRLEPVDIANTAVGEMLIRDRAAKLARYGAITHNIDLGSAANNAFILRGAEFYVDLMIDKDFARHYMDVITETMCLAYRFVGNVFDPIEGFPLANCNVTMISPELYTEMIREYDIRCVEYAATMTGKPPCCDLHHCDVKTEPFAETYAAIPGLRSLQGSHLSDIEHIHRVLPDVSFSAMVNPAGLLNKPASQTHRELDRCIAAGASDLAVWDIDPQITPEKMVGFVDMIKNIAQQYGREAVFSVTPFSWEELDWEFPRYRP